MSNIREIEVLGTSCPSCHELHRRVQQAVSELGLNIEVNYADDIKRIIEIGQMSSPVLLVNGQVVLVGQVPSLERLKDIMADLNNPGPI